MLINIRQVKTGVSKMTDVSVKARAAFGKKDEIHLEYNQKLLTAIDEKINNGLSYNEAVLSSVKFDKKDLAAQRQGVEYYILLSHAQDMKKRASVISATTGKAKLVASKDFRNNLAVTVRSLSAKIKAKEINKKMMDKRGR